MAKSNKELKKWMAKNRFTPSVLSRELGVKSPSTVWEWVNNERVPHPDTMRKFTALISRVDSNPFPAENFFKE